MISIRKASMDPCKILMFAARDKMDPTIVNHQPSNIHASASTSKRIVPVSICSMMKLVAIIGSNMMALVPNIADIVGINRPEVRLNPSKLNTISAATTAPIKIVMVPENKFKSGRDMIIEVLLTRKYKPKDRARRFKLGGIFSGPARIKQIFQKYVIICHIR